MRVDERKEAKIEANGHFNPKVPLSDTDRENREQPSKPADHARKIFPQAQPILTESCEMMTERRRRRR